MALVARRRGDGALRLALAGLTVFWLVAGTVSAQELFFDSWTTENGLPQNSVTDIIQTPDGYLWLATFGGLVRFDGHQFTVFDLSVEGVGSVRTRALHVDRTGTLWAGTDDGVLLRYRDGRFSTFTSDDGLPGRAVLRIDESDSGDIWVTWDAAVTRFDGETFTNYRPGDLAHGVLPHQIRGYLSPHAVWWNALSDGVYCLLDGRVERCLSADTWAPADIVWVSTDRTGSVWFQARDGRVIQKTPGRLHVSGPGEEAGDGRSLDPIFLEDRTGALWTLDRGGALVRFRQGYRASAQIDAMTVFEDREGTIWVGAQSGLHRLRDPAISMITTRQGLSVDNVYSILRDRLGDVWVGSWGRGVTRLSGGRARVYGIDEGLPAGYITALFEDAAGRIFVGTAAGLTLFNDDRLHPYEDPHGWLAGVVSSIAEDHAGYWFGTGTGLVRESGDRLERFTVADGLTHDGITALHRDRAGTLWIGTARGLTVLRDGVFSGYRAADGFVGNHVRAFHEDDRGVLWIGTYDGGLYRLEQEHLTRFTTRNGLPDNGAFQILDDGRGYFWISSNRGIYRVSRAELDHVAIGRASTVRPVTFGTRDGMATAECNGGRQPAGMRMPDGTLWFPTQKGIAVIDPATVRPAAPLPPVLIQEVRLSGEPAQLLAAVHVPPDRNILEVHYTAMSFVRPEQTRFRHRLVGLDDDWIEAGGRRSAVYYRLPPGHYLFEVTAANGDGAWNPAGATIAVVVHAPVWRRGWFLALVGLAILVATGFGVRRRFLRLEREHARQRAFGRQLLDTQEHERRRISNELHDSLGQGLFMIKTRARAHRHAADAAPSAAVLEEIESLVSESYGDMKRISQGLRPWQLDKIGLSKTIEGMLARVADTCGTAFDIDVDNVDSCFSSPQAINVFRIVQEAVNNVVRHAPSSRASVRVRRLGARVEIVVSDDGPGFDVATTSAGAGFGLMGIRERTLALGGSMTVRSRPGDGTVLTATLPTDEARHG
jgi:signal transduction histidine kinase/ligand-binding sensor domain-containing protein